MDNSASIQPARSIFISRGKSVQISGATSQHLAEKPLSVTHAMALKKLASPATLHRKIDALREAGLIEQIFVGKNRRTKYLVPTKDTHAYFAKLSKAIMSAVNS